MAIDPDNGGVLALVSKPDYDLSDFSGVTSPEAWNKLNDDDEKPLFNRATLTRYPPGSTFKMILAIAALENHVIDETGAFNAAERLSTEEKFLKMNTSTVQQTLLKQSSAHAMFFSTSSC